MRGIKAGMLGVLLCAPISMLNAQAPESQPEISYDAVLDSAQEEPEDRRKQRPQIGAIVISGNEAVDDSQYQAIAEEYFGEPLTDEALDRLNDELSEVTREAGYPYSRALINRDAAALGILEVTIDEGRIDAIAIEGSYNAMADRMLQRLVGRPAKRSEMQSVLLLVSDIPAVMLRSAKLRRIDGRGVLVVTLDKRNDEGRVAFDNYGTAAFGPIRASASTRFSDAFGSADELRANLRINPVDPEELLFSSVSYRTQLTTKGLTVEAGVGVGNTTPGGELDGSDINGDTRSAYITMTQPLRRSRDGSVWVRADLGYLSIKQDDLIGMLRDDTVVTASVGMRTRFALAGGTGRTSVSLERGLGIFGATRLGDQYASRSDGDGVFTKFRFSADARLPVSERVDLYLSGAGQLADRPLLGSEELGLGGAYRVRGYDFAEVLGDEGVFGLAELRYRMDTEGTRVRFLQIYAFVDGGYVTDIDLSTGEGSLFSAGPGLRAQVGSFDLEVESAFPLGGSGEVEADYGPQINIRAGVNF